MKIKAMHSPLNHIFGGLQQGQVPGRIVSCGTCRASQLGAMQATEFLQKTAQRLTRGVLVPDPMGVCAEDPMGEPSSEPLSKAIWWPWTLPALGLPGMELGTEPIPSEPLSKLSACPCDIACSL